MSRPATYQQGIAGIRTGPQSDGRRFLEYQPTHYAFFLVGRTAEARVILRTLEAGSQDHVRAFGCGASL